MYREIIGEKEINISHDLSDREDVRNESLDFLDLDLKLVEQFINYVKIV